MYKRTHATELQKDLFQRKLIVRENRHTWRECNLMCSQIFFTAWGREISPTPRNLRKAGDTGICFMIPLPLVGSADTAANEAGAALALEEAAARRALERLKTLDMAGGFRVRVLRVWFCFSRRESRGFSVEWKLVNIC